MENITRIMYERPSLGYDDLRVRVGSKFESEIERALRIETMYELFTEESQRLLPFSVHDNLRGVIAITCKPYEQISNILHNCDRGKLIASSIGANSCAV